MKLLDEKKPSVESLQLLALEAFLVKRGITISTFGGIVNITIGKKDFYLFNVETGDYPTMLPRLENNQKFVEEDTCPE